MRECLGGVPPELRDAGGDGSPRCCLLLFLPRGAARTASGPAGGSPLPFSALSGSCWGWPRLCPPSLQFPCPQDVLLSPCTPPRMRRYRALPAQCLPPGCTSLGCPRLQAPRVPSPSSWPCAWDSRGSQSPVGHRAVQVGTPVVVLGSESPQLTPGAAEGDEHPWLVMGSTSSTGRWEEEQLVGAQGGL